MALDKGREGWHFRGVIQVKLEQLRALLRSYGSCLIAYSGGVDSVFLACVAREVLGEKALAAIADSPSLPRRELAEALQIAERFQIPVRVVQTNEFINPDYLANPANRCYFCKHELFEELAPLAQVEHFAVIAYGENASDVGDFRPGSQAAKEFQVRAPLKEVGLTKTEIRELSALLGLPTADKPQMACLSSRIPHGEAVTPEKLRMIEAAEYVLKDLGFYDVRVRLHDLSPSGAAESPTRARVLAVGNPNGGSGALNCRARIEVGVAELSRLRANDMLQSVTGALMKIGFAEVAVDLQGYRRGSLNPAPATPG